MTLRPALSVLDWAVRPSAVRRLILAGLVAFGACGDAPSRDLATLAVVDSVYVDPGSGEPFTGPVHRPFDAAPDETQIEGRLSEGVWHGEFRVFHTNGRVRYMGSFHRGSRCGPWTENVDSLDSGSVYDRLVDEIESLGMYPPCPEER